MLNIATHCKTYSWLSAHVHHRQKEHWNSPSYFFISTQHIMWLVFFWSDVLFLKIRLCILASPKWKQHRFCITENEAFRKCREMVWGQWPLLEVMSSPGLVLACLLAYVTRMLNVPHKEVFELNSWKLIFLNMNMNWPWHRFCGIRFYEKFRCPPN